MKRWQGLCALNLRRRCIMWQWNRWNKEEKMSNEKSESNDVLIKSNSFVRSNIREYRVLLSSVSGAFFIGFAFALGLQQIVSLEPVQKHTYILKDDLENNYIGKEAHTSEINQLKQKNQNMKRRLESDYVTKDDLNDNYIRKETHTAEINQLKQKNENVERSLESNYVFKSEYNYLIKQLNEKDQELSKLRTQFTQEKKGYENRLQELRKINDQVTSESKRQDTEAQFKLKEKEIESRERSDFIRDCVEPTQVVASGGVTGSFFGKSASQCANEYEKLKNERNHFLK